MKRERGSQPSMVVCGGQHDGAVGRIRGQIERAGQQYHLVELKDGTLLEVAAEGWESATLPREIGS